MILEVGLLVLDIGSDFANGGKFILDGHLFVGGLTIALVFLPGLVSCEPATRIDKMFVK